MKNKFKFDNLITHIRKYDSLSLINKVIEHGNIISNSAHIDLRKSPHYWELDLLCRLIYKYGRDNKKPIDENQFIKLCRKLRKLRNGGELNLDEQVQRNSTASSSIGFVSRILRRTAFSQLRYQYRLPIESLARQYIMFVKLDKENILNKKFKQVSNIDIKVFLSIYLALLFLIEKYGNQVPLLEANTGLQKLSTLNTKLFTYSNFEEFFKLTSKDISDAREFIKQYEEKIGHKDINFQLFEETPFERYPFFKSKTYYTAYHRPLLNAAAENNLYDMCKEVDPNVCGEYNADTGEGGLGQIFEQYIHQGLEYYICSTKTEKALYNDKDIKEKFLFGRKYSCADYLLIEDNVGIIVECKSTEYRKKSRLIQSRESRIEALKNQVVKGTRQVVHTVDLLLKTKAKLADTEKIQAFYGIVVTYKQYYLGSGSNFYNEMKEWLPPSTQIAPKNIFYMTVDELDCLIAGVMAKKTSIAKVLFSLADYDAKNNLKFSISLLNLWGQEWYTAPYLTETIDYMKNVSLELVSSAK